MLESSGERIVPELQRGELIYAEHLARYLLASQLAAGKRLLDAGCGEGYGTALLAAAGAASVVGVDVDEPTIEHARQRYGGEFRVADVVQLPFDAGSFDLVVCFETIEHVAKAPEAVAELRRVLADDGVLVISTPNPAEYVVDNEFHVREYTPGEFAELLDEHFPEQMWLYQQNWLLSAILVEDQLRADQETQLDMEIRKTAVLEPGRELYSVVVCGTKGAVPKQVGVASGVYEAQEMAEKVSAAERTRAAWQERATFAERQREGWEQRATTAERQREGWEKRATTAERQREVWEERAAEGERQLHETRERLKKVEDALEEIVSSRSWRITAPLRRGRARLEGLR
jgi:O-antigen biosynthesis protein